MRVIEPPWSPRLGPGRGRNEFDDLARLLPDVEPPEVALEWEAALTEVGVPLPSDYLSFMERFGAGLFCDIEIAGLRRNDRFRVVDFIRQQHAAARARNGPFPPFFPDQLGLIPWGRTLDGWTCCWGPSSLDVDQWGVVAVPADPFHVSYYRGFSFSSFLLRYCGHGELLQLELHGREAWEGEVRFVPEG